MTERENEIYSIIKKNPLISQQELSELLDIARSSVGVHISNLIKKGYVKGKGYVMRQEEYCLIIGGAYVEIVSEINKKTESNFTKATSTSMNVGGTWKEIIKDINEYGVDTKFLTVFGDDIHNNYLLKEIKNSGTDYSYSFFLKNTESASFFSIFNENNQLEISIVSDGIYNLLTPGFIKRNFEIINNTNLIILDTCIPIETIEFILETNKDKNYFLNVVPFTKINKVKNILNSFRSVSMDFSKLENLLEIKIEDYSNLAKSAEGLFENKLNELFITTSSEEVYHLSKQTNGIILSKKLETKKQIFKIYISKNY